MNASRQRRPGGPPPPPGVRARLAAHGLRVRSAEALAGDVGTRRYWRLRLAEPPPAPLAAGACTAVLAVYPDTDRGACRRFELTGALLRDAGVRVPSVLAADCSRGWMAVEDLGADTVYALRGRPWPEVAPFFAAAARAADRIAALPASEVAGLSPPLDEGLLRRELERTREVYLEPEGLLPDGLGERLFAALGELCRELGAAPARPCHRDLMVRNLVPLAGGEVGVLDHQDLRLGPPLYDLASLLNDSLFPPPEAEDGLLAVHAPSADDRLAYHRAAAQRTLKAVGTFAAFARRGKPAHLPLIAPTLGRALRHLASAPETAGVAAEAARAWRRAAAT